MGSAPSSTPPSSTTPRRGRRCVMYPRLRYASLSSRSTDRGDGDGNGEFHRECSCIWSTVMRRARARLALRSDDCDETKEDRHISSKQLKETLSNATQSHKNGPLPSETARLHLFLQKRNSHIPTAKRSTQPEEDLYRSLPLSLIESLPRELLVAIAASLSPTDVAALALSSSVLCFLLLTNLRSALDFPYRREALMVEIARGLQRRWRLLRMEKNNSRNEDDVYGRILQDEPFVFCPCRLRPPLRCAVGPPPQHQCVLQDRKNLKGSSSTSFLPFSSIRAVSAYNDEALYLFHYRVPLPYSLPSSTTPAPSSSTQFHYPSAGQNWCFDGKKWSEVSALPPSFLGFGTAADVSSFVNSEGAVVLYNGAMSVRYHPLCNEVDIKPFPLPMWPFQSDKSKSDFDEVMHLRGIRSEPPLRRAESAFAPQIFNVGRMLYAFNPLIPNDWSNVGESFRSPTRFLATTVVDLDTCSTNHWRSCAAMPLALNQCSVCIDDLSGSAYLIGLDGAAVTHWMKYDMMSDCWRAWNPLCNARRRISSLSPRKGVSADASLVCHESPGGGGGKALFLMDSREGLWQYDVRAGVLNDITPRDSKFHRPVELKCCNEKLLLMTETHAFEFDPYNHSLRNLALPSTCPSPKDALIAKGPSPSLARGVLGMISA